MKNNKSKVVIAVIVISVLVICGVLFFYNKPSDTQTKTENKNLNEYEKAYENTKKLSDYEMTFSTIVTIDDGFVRQSAIEQEIRVKNKNDNNLIFSVATNSTSTDTSSSDVVNESVSYTYYNSKYYYTLPGVRYKSPVAIDAARSNIEHLTDAVFFSYDEMENVTKEDTKDGTVYYYTIDYEDASDYVKALKEQALRQLGDGVFETEITASALVKDGYVTERDVYIECVKENGDVAIVELYSNLIQTKTSIDIPDDSQFLDVTK